MLRTLKLKVYTGEIVEFTVIHQAEIGIENDGFTYPGSSDAEVEVLVGTVEGLS